ncbi:hypothetical protein D9613_005729 [Agrocybe pediades]|uniref:NAD(P)-binding protein n=1 Tax=Agrocybe pediades TaxID=84607 RepID=A0A8H4QVG2_9AGAR|nr:hypothetical protein D9613_005729 [Agrocybe pediades]
MSRVILGIGFELVRLLAEKGYIVYLGARNPASGEEAAKSLQDEGHKNVRFVHLDVTQKSTIDAAKTKIEQEEGKLDTLVNNAGISRMDAAQDALTVPTAVLRDTMETNFFGLIETTQAFIPLLRKSKLGVITNVSTRMGCSSWLGSPEGSYHQWVAYNTSKAAMNSYTIALAHELKNDKIKVNAVTPGFTSTKLNFFSPGGRTMREGASSILPLAILEEEGPSGKFFNFDGTEASW